MCEVALQEVMVLAIKGINSQKQLPDDTKIQILHFLIGEIQ